MEAEVSYTFLVITLLLYSEVIFSSKGTNILSNYWNLCMYLVVL